jgi:acetate kinase
MNVLIFNCGSSSQGFKVYGTGVGRPPQVLIAGKARNVATKTKASASLDWEREGKSEKRELDLSTHALAAEAIIAVLSEKRVAVDAIGHRFVHGGSKLTSTTLIDAATLPVLWKTAPLAPIHNPNSLAVIEVCLREFPGVPEYAVFDTMFHAGMPEEAYTFAIPAAIREKLNLRKFGFHGLSYQYVSRRTAELLGRPVADLRMVIAHLGTGGSSVVAVQGGRSLDTSIGTTMSGLVMSTRCGDIAPEVELALARDGYDVDEIEDILANKSGLVALAQVSSDLLEIIAEADKGDKNCKLAFAAYSHRLSLYVGAYFWLLGGADAIVFTDDVGTRAWQVREAVCRGAKGLGVSIDPEANRRAVGVEAFVQAPGSGTAILVVPTDEEGVILDEVLRQVGESGGGHQQGP